MALNSTYYSVQYLRFVAATMVVFVHISHSLSIHLASETAGLFVPGGTGVDIFFVISGFIMFVITRQNSRGSLEFFLMRFTRIAPPYWAITTVVLAIILIKPSLFYASSFDVKHTLASYFFIPWQHPNAHVQPLLHVGWTLNVEFLFYSIMSLILLVKRAHGQRMYLVVLLLCVLTVLGYVFKPELPIPMVWTSSVLMEFAFGILVARAYFSDFQIPVLVSVGMITLGFTLLMHVSELGGVYDRSRWIVAGMPATLIVWGALELEKRRFIPNVAWLKYLGDISFALYLCHYFAIGFVRALWPSDLIGGTLNDVSFYLVALALSFLGSMLFYELGEKPLVKISQGFVRKKLSTSSEHAKRNSKPIASK